MYIYILKLFLKGMTNKIHYSGNLSRMGDAGEWEKG